MNDQHPFTDMRNTIRIALVLLWAAALCVMFRDTCLLTMGAFRDPANDLAHGWAIPPAALIMGCARWKELRAVAGRPSWGGLVLLPPMFALLWLGIRGGQSRFSQLAMILSIPAVAWIGWGRGVARLLLFPAVFMLFIIPLGFLDFITLPLRIASSAISTFLLNGISIDAVNEGSALLSKSGKFQLDVADPCSGIKSIFAILALSLGYGFFCQKTTLRVLVLAAVGVPLAVAGNIVRLTTIGIVANMFGQARAMQVFHDFSGFITFSAALMILIPVSDRWISKIGRVPPAKPPAPPARQAAWPAGLCALLLAALATAGMAATLGRMPATRFDPDTFIAETLPETLGGMKGERSWFCHEPNCMEHFTKTEIEKRLRDDGGWQTPEGGAQDTPDGPGLPCPFCKVPLHPQTWSEHLYLPADTRIMKTQYGNAPDSWDVSVVVSGRSRTSIHRPEMCLPGQGYQIISKTPRTLVLDGGGRLDVMVFKVGKYGKTFGFVNFMASDRVQTASHFRRICRDIWQRSVHGRINRWAMFSLVATRPIETPGDFEDLRVMLSEWLPAVYLANLPRAR